MYNFQNVMFQIFQEKNIPLTYEITRLCLSDVEKSIVPMRLDCRRPSFSAVFSVLLQLAVLCFQLHYYHISS